MVGRKQHARLSSLDRLKLQGNQLSSLPEGVFAGLLLSLSVLLLYKNALGPLPLSVSLEKAGDSGFKATVPAVASRVDRKSGRHDPPRLAGALILAPTPRP